MITIAIDCGASFLKGAKLIENKIERIVLKEAPCAKKTSEIFKVGQINNLILAVKDMIHELAEDEKSLTAFCLNSS